MSKGDWLRDGPAIGLILFAVLWLGFFLGRIELVERPEPIGSNQAACAEGDYANCDTSPKVLDPSGEYVPADPYSDSYRNEYREERDLIAQRQMADWAAAMFVATLLGVVLLFFTLTETRRTNRLFGEASARELRAYLAVSRARVTCVKIDEKPLHQPIGVRRYFFHLNVTYSNNGKTIADKVRTQCRCFYVDGDRGRVYKLQDWKTKVPFSMGPTQTDGLHNPIVIDLDPAASSLAVRKKRTYIRLMARIDYVDYLGRDRVTRIGYRTDVTLLEAEEGWQDGLMAHGNNTAT